MNVVVVYHSGYGHTKNVAEAVAIGIEQVDGVVAQKVPIDVQGDIDAAAWNALDAADAIVFGTPTYMGCVSWQFKKFAEDSSKRWFQLKWKDKLAAGFTNSASMNGDKHSTIAYLMTLAMQHGMVWLGTGLMPANNKASDRDDINYLGAFSGLMAQSPADADANDAPTKGDIETAKLYGERVAQWAKKLGSVG
ncbi:flavodoxin family protein [Vibrio sp. SM6]|uniref:Flavodoxin family protein n=1 Tax=Vibrio agarilyticus TaxID=2726741 RepID=A0A7X8TP13_9VIBR|nr:flavodoxin family protein [Vibrio agarilyticus]NLS11533.1 flavodoxin family protein [Vibrio agarilyticus]